MKTIELTASKRSDVGKSSTKQLRKNEQVPCVLYGGKETIHFAAPTKSFNKLIFTPNVYIISLNIDDQKVNAIIKDIQYHPVSDEVQHIDFLQISDDKPVTIEIPVKLNGFAEGVKAGGKLQLEMRKLRVKGLSKYLPDTLDIDINNLGLGKTIKVGQLEFDNLELLNAKNAVVVAVKLTRAARAAQQNG
ncbi:MAG: 50S ribosomal protein L25/general stress protein Ctc [Marinilabiliaceae bacterium]|nr:50S ribosomal protein L25/general stress protein Ctc [Marinilabiliaceae bacterium]